MDLDQIYMTSSAWYATGFRDTWATFDLLVRDMPPHRNFLVFTGLEEIIRNIMHWRYSAKNIRVLRKHKLISPSFARYLARFKFHGTVHAMREGTIFFPGEPVLRITAPAIEANLLTGFLITAVSSNTMYASKFVRSVLAGQGKSVIGTAIQRGTSFEQVFKCARSSVIAGSGNTGLPIVREKIHVPLGNAATIVYHAFIMSYPTEAEAMEAAEKAAQVDFSIMIDTYDVKKGLAQAIAVAERRKKQKKVTKIVIDSGDVLAISRYVRKTLDAAGLQSVPITIAGNMDEYKITRLVRAQIPANTFIVHTEALTSSDAPKLEVVYKLAEILRNGTMQPTMKLSQGKVSLPGRKQVFRVFRRGQYIRDIIGLDGERLGAPLLRPMIIRGKQVYRLPSVMTMQSFVRKELTHLPARFKEVTREYRYPVFQSKKLQRLARVTAQALRAQYG